MISVLQAVKAERGYRKQLLCTWYGLDEHLRGRQYVQPRGLPIALNLATKLYQNSLQK